MDADPATCYCREPAGTDEARIVCDGGSTCMWGARFHSDCIEPLNRALAQSGNSFVCRDCASARAASALAAAEDQADARGDLDEGSTHAAASSLAAAADHDLPRASVLSAASPVDAAHVSAPVSRTLAAARSKFGVPGVISALRKVLRHEDVDNLIAQLHKLEREGRTVAADTMVVLEEILARGPAEGHFVQLVKKTNSAGVVVSMRFSWATREMRSNALMHRLSECVLGRDYSANTVTCGFLLGADVGVSAKANGKSCVVAYHLILSEKGIDGSWGEHLEGAACFVQDVMGLSEPTVQLTDKDKAAIGSWHVTQRKRLLRPALDDDLAALLRDLDAVGAGATDNQIALARIFVEHQPSFVSVTPHASLSMLPPH